MYRDHLLTSLVGWVSIVLFARPVSGAVAVPLTPTEFRVNASTAGAHVDPLVAVFPGGGFVVTWLSDDLFGRRYASSGLALGTEFQLNTQPGLVGERGGLTADPFGGFVAVWSGGGDGSSCGVFARRYANDGLALGADFQVNTYTTNCQRNPSVAAGSAGGFVVVWTSPMQDGDDYAVFGQRYDSAGNTVGTEFQVNTYTTNSQSAPAVTMEPAGGFVVVWTSATQDGDDDGIFGQRYDSAGNTVGTEFQVNAHTADRQLSRAVVNMEPAGGFVVVWESEGQDGNEYGVFGRRYDSAGSLVGTEFQVNTYTPGDQFTPAVAASPAGGFVVAWATDGIDDYEIAGQLYDSAGAVLGTEFQLNTDTEFRQVNPWVASDAAGGFAAVWMHNPNLGFPSEEWDVFARRYAICGDGVEGPGELCDDGNNSSGDGCTAVCQPGCDAVPASGCRQAATSVLRIDDSVADNEDKLRWKWAKGQATSQVEFGDPEHTAAYSLCVYAGTAETLVVEANIPAVDPPWKPIGTKGFKYKDDSAGAAGIRKVVLKGSVEDKAKVLVKGDGDNLPDLSLPLPLPVRTQVMNSDTPIWWEATYVSGGVIENEPGMFKAKAH